MKDSNVVVNDSHVVAKSSHVTALTCGGDARVCFELWLLARV